MLVSRHANQDDRIPLNVIMSLLNIDLCVVCTFSSNIYFKSIISFDCLAELEKLHMQFDGKSFYIMSLFLF